MYKALKNIYQSEKPTPAGDNRGGRGEVRYLDSNVYS